MALHGLLTRGIRSTLDAHRGDLESLARTVGLPTGSGEHLAQTIEAIPGLLVALDHEVQASNDPAIQRMWSSLVSYLLLDDDLVPSRDGAPVEGLLDDAYLVHIAVERMMVRVSRRTAIDPRSIAGGASLLRVTLPSGVVRALGDRLDAALARDVPT